MNARSRRIALVAALALPAASAAAAPDRAADAAQARALAATRAPVDAGEVRALALAEPDDPPSDYAARTVTLRVFGVQNPGTPDAFATVADAGTWDTRDLRVGDAIGRNLVVRAVEPAALVLAEGAREVRLPVGADVAVRVVEHAFDRAVTVREGHARAVDARVLERVRARYGAGARGEVVTAFGPALKVMEVDPRGVIGRLGFEPGDLLQAFDGAPVAPGDLDRIAAAVAAGGAVHRLDVLRHGARFTVVLEPAEGAGGESPAGGR
jgi:hypothetical protein